MTTATQKQGHAADTQAADQQGGLPGVLQRPIKVTMIGAGSHFTIPLMNDILAIPGADRGEIALVDTDTRRLKPMNEIVGQLVQAHGRGDGWKVTSTTDRNEALPGADYLINSIDVGGVENVHHDNDIPLKYGVDQCIGDTLGPGGLFKALRTVPVWLDILRDAAKHCPDAIVLNYTNPMSMMMLAAGRAVPQMQAVGLCHSVQASSRRLAEYAEVPYDQMTWSCAGINHLAWFVRAEHEGKDLYETYLYEKFRREVEAGVREADEGKASHDSSDVRGRDTDNLPYDYIDLVRKDMCVNFGAYITESSGHLSEYLPYYRKSDRGRKLLRLGYSGGSSFYARNWPNWRKSWDADRDAMLGGEQAPERTRSWEYASWIVEAREKDQPWQIYGNVMNHDGTGKGELITNLPTDGCVEVACTVDRDGLHPNRFGALPPQMAGVCDMNMRMIDLAATACIEKSKEAAVHALMLDPLTAAVCTPGEIRDMTLEMFDAERDFLQSYK